ncbi:MAG: integrase core domain-containing protein [Bryobacteraceae bacterium]|jgi:transposase InsO family protein
MFPLFAYLCAFVHTRHDLGLEILALRQQVSVLQRKRPRPRLNDLDRLFWLALKQLWSRWSDVLIVVKQETVVGWHRSGFRLFWRFRSRGGGRRIDERVFEIVRRIARENPSWGAPRIHGELLMLGFDISERTVSRYLMRRLPRSGDAAKNWLAFLANHREAIAALDFFTVPTITFRLLYSLFVIDHGRRRILHFNVTAHPTAEWVMQQLRETFSDADHHRFVIMDRDSKFSPEVIELLESSGIRAVRTGIRSPWQNGVAERWVGSARRECFDHVIALDESHVRRLAREYMAYYHADRTHDGLGKDTPNGRAIDPKPSGAELVSLPRVGGLHHRYCWKTALDSSRTTRHLGDRQEIGK